MRRTSHQMNVIAKIVYVGHTLWGVQAFRQRFADLGGMRLADVDAWIDEGRFPRDWQDRLRAAVLRERANCIESMIASGARAAELGECAQWVADIRLAEEEEAA